MKLLNELRFLSVSTLVFMLISMFAVSYLFFYHDSNHHLGNNYAGGSEKADSLPGELALTTNQNKGKTLFNLNCGRCHSTTNQKIIGPGLGNIMERIDTVQMVNWVQNSEKLRQIDPYFKELFMEYNQPMPAFPELKREDVISIIEYIEVSG
jgi:hypothetical protein